MTKNTYTAAQINLLRHRLKQHREATPDVGRRCITWEKVAKDIADATGYPIGAEQIQKDQKAAADRLKRFGERLRQFVEGVRVSGKGPAMLSAPALEAVRAYLVDDEYARRIDPAEWEAAQPRAGYISIMVRIPLEDVLERGSQALLDRIELDPMAFIVDDGGAPGEEIGNDDSDRHCSACRKKLT